MLHQLPSDGIEVHVSGHRPEVGLVFDQFGTIAALEHMSRKAVAARPAIRVARQKRLHARGEIGLGGLENDVQVIGHDGERVNTPGTPNDGSTEVFSEPVAVDVIAYDVLTPIAASHEG